MNYGKPISVKSRRAIFLAWSGALALMVVILSLVGTTYQADAGPITGGAGNPPYPRFSVYQGIVAISPSGGQILKLGRLGRYIESTTNIGLKPQNGAVFIAPQNSTNEGAQVVLAPPSGTAFAEWNIDTYRVSPGVVDLRIFNGPNEKLRIGTNGEVHLYANSSLAPGSICFGSDCRNVWPTSSGTPSSQNLDEVLATGNGTDPGQDRTIVVGYANCYNWTVYGLGLLEASNSDNPFCPDPADPFNSIALINPVTKNSVSAKSSAALGSGSGLYAENTGGGLAAYFFGRVGVFGTTDPGFATTHESPLVRVAGNIAYNSGSVLDVRNTDPTGMAARIVGVVNIAGNGSGGLNAPATLNVRNSNVSGTTMRVVSANSGIVVDPGTAAAGGTTYGLYAAMGDGGPVGTSYAGYFIKGIGAGELTVRAYGGAEPWGVKFGAQPVAKRTIEQQVCQIGTDSCLGKYVSSTGTTAADLRYWYETGAALVSQLVYVPATSTMNYEIR